MSERNLDFDKVIDRHGTKCLKYDFAEKRGYPKDIASLWVADMDFATSSYIEDALSELVHHNIYGYSDTQPGDGFFEAVSGWMKRHHNWDVKREWHFKTPGVCFAISNALRAVTEPDDAVIIMQPVYYPFSSIVRQQSRKLVVTELINDGNGYYTFDIDDFEKQIIDNDVKMFILCNPHNPVGRVWSRDELKAIGDVCKKHGVVVFSDEIHSDFVWRGEHVVFQEIDPSFREFTITATAPSKTFNLAGLQQSNLFIPNKDLYDRFEKEYEITGLDEPNICGITAAQAAYEHGDEWYEAMKKYVRANIDYTIEFCKEHLPTVKVTDPEGTYLMWLDFRALGLNDKELDNLIIYKAGLWLDAGRIFGKGGSGFQRINVTCPRSVLKDALERIERVVKA